jgi:flavin-dependent dehydrogenase
VFFPKHLLPGYAAIMRHPNDELNFCTYIIPGGKARNEDLHDLHYGLIKDDPYVSKALGPKADIEPMRPGSLRLGGVPRSHGNHVIVIGDAAGLIDPLTGEGIHFALASGKMGAQAIIAAFAASNFSSSFLKTKWDDRWQGAWGSEFYWSMKICQVFYYFPGLLDAAAKVIRRKGADFLLQWGMVRSFVVSLLFNVKCLMVFLFR